MFCEAWLNHEEVAVPQVFLDAKGIFEIAVGQVLEVILACGTSEQRAFLKLLKELSRTVSVLQIVPLECASDLLELVESRKQFLSLSLDGEAFLNEEVQKCVWEHVLKHVGVLVHVPLVVASRVETLDLLTAHAQEHQPKPHERPNRQTGRN